MREYSEMIEEYLNDIDGLEDVSPSAAPVRPAELAAELESDVAAVLKAADSGAGQASMQEPEGRMDADGEEEVRRPALTAVVEWRDGHFAGDYV